MNDPLKQGILVHILAECSLIERMHRLEQLEGELRGTGAGLIVVDDGWLTETHKDVTGTIDSSIGTIDGWVIRCREEPEIKPARVIPHSPGDTWRRQGKRKGARRK